MFTKKSQNVPETAKTCRQKEEEPYRELEFMSEWVLLAAGMLIRGQVGHQPFPVLPINGVIKETDSAPVPQTPIRADVERSALDLPEFSASDRPRISASHHSPVQRQSGRYSLYAAGLQGSNSSNFSIRIAGMPASLVPPSGAGAVRWPRLGPAQHQAIATSSSPAGFPSDRLDPLWPQSTALSTPRPFNGSQLYQQRLAALRRGRTYTRLPADSFHADWVNATEQPTYQQWTDLLRSEAEAIARGRGNNRLSVLIGDSISQWYPSEWLSGDRFWLNQGISGDTTTGVLQRLDAFAQIQPDTIHLMVGINDLRRGASDAEILSNIRQIIYQLRQSHPHAQILVYSILPTRLPALATSRIRGINESLRAIASQPQVTYRDLQAYFADPSGILRTELTTDGLHLSRQGYAVWQWAMQRLT